MPVTWYCFFHRGVSTPGLSDAERRKVAEAIGAAANLRTAYVHTPSPEPHPHAGEDIAPVLALELEFADVADCESALRQGGDLRRLGDPGFLPDLAGTGRTGDQPRAGAGGTWVAGASVQTRVLWGTSAQ